VCLVEYQNVPVTVENRLPVSIAFRSVDARNDVIVGVEVLEFVVVVADEVESEFVTELRLPLFGQLCRSENEDGFVRFAEVHLFENHSDLDGLSKPNLVCEEGFPVHLEEGTVSRIHLMFE